MIKRTFNVRATLRAGLLIATLMGVQSMSHAQSPPVSVHIHGSGGSGVMRVNGIPAQAFRHEAGKQASTTGVAHMTMARNGRNEIVVEVTINAPGGEIVVAMGEGFPPANKTTFTKSGSARHTYDASGLPEWAWSKADKVTDAKAELQKAIKDLHALMQRKDKDGFFKLRQPAMDDLVKINPQVAARQEGMKQYLGELMSKGKLGAIPAELIYESHEDGRLWVVVTPDYQVPIRLQGTGEMANASAETGQFWARFNGEWKLVR